MPEIEIAEEYQPPLVDAARIAACRFLLADRFSG
jgi:hypothetical protein